LATFATFVMSISVLRALCLDVVGGPEAVHCADVMVVLFWCAGVSKSRNEVPADLVEGRRMPLLFLDNVIAELLIVVCMEELILDMGKNGSVVKHNVGFAAFKEDRLWRERTMWAVISLSG